MIIDFSTWRPSVHTLQSASVTAVGRYIGWDGEPGFQDIGKNLTKTEAHTYLNAGIDIFLSFEYAADAALSGFEQGLKDCALANRQLRDLGAPQGMTVYYALDFDIKDYAPASSDPKAKLGPAALYFEGIHAGKPNHTVGVYGGYWAVSRAMDAGLAQMGWQTIAWSGGQWYEKAALRQLASQFMGQADVNLHGLRDPDDFGQWPRPVKQHTGPAKVMADGHTSLRRAAQSFGTGVPATLWETAQHEPGGFGRLQVDYIRAGNWDAPMPEKMVVWLP